MEQKSGYYRAKYAGEWEIVRYYEKENDFSRFNISGFYNETDFEVIDWDEPISAEPEKKENGWLYYMFKDQNSSISCVIYNGRGDVVCKMMRDDAPNYRIQEEWAKQIINFFNSEPEKQDYKAKYEICIETIKKFDACINEFKIFSHV